MSELLTPEDPPPISHVFCRHFFFSPGLFVYFFHFGTLINFCYLGVVKLKGKKMMIFMCLSFYNFTNII